MSNKNLEKYVKDIYLAEKGARELYDNYLKELNDPEEIKTVTKIRDDEIRHIEMAEELLELIK